MSGARSRKLRGSLGDSWGDAGYSSDGGASIHSASSFSDAGSESEFDLHHQAQEKRDIATPLPPRNTRARSQTPQDTPVKTPASRVTSRAGTHSQRSTPRSFQSTPESMEPSFIMPSMGGQSFHNGSPLRNSQIRARKARHSSVNSQLGSTNSSPQIKSRRASAFTSQPPLSHDDMEEGQEVGPWYYIDLFRQHVLWPIVRYFLDVFRYAMVHFMQPILGALLGLVLVVSILHFTSGFLQKAVQTALAPVCIIPGISYIVPFCNTGPSHIGNADFEELVNVQNAFGDVVEASKESGDLSAQMQFGKNAVVDLRTLAKYSQLPSRAQLEVEFTAFIDTAKEAAAQLTTYQVKIASTLNRIIVTNEWTLRDLEGIADKEVSATPMRSYFNPFSVFAPTPASLDELIFDRYTYHLGQVKDNVENLIEIARTLIALLNALEDQIEIIGDIAIRDKIIVSRNQDELLSQLWTMLGGNRASKKEFERSIALLRQVNRYKGEALNHVTKTLTKLREISAGLDNLREEVATPELVGYGRVPTRYHIEVIGRSLDSFKDMEGNKLGMERDAVRRAMNRLPDDGDVLKGLPSGAKEMPTVYAKSAKE